MSLKLADFVMPFVILPSHLAKTGRLLATTFNGTRMQFTGDHSVFRRDDYYLLTKFALGTVKY